jgi:hypothetical protein
MLPVHPKYVALPHTSTMPNELTHAGPKDADREAEPRKLSGQADRTPSGVVCSDFVCT